MHILVLPACTNNHLTIFQAREIDRNFVETVIKKKKKDFLGIHFLERLKSKILRTELETGEHAYFNSFSNNVMFIFLSFEGKNTNLNQIGREKNPFLLDNNRISFELAYVPIHLSSTESFQGLLRPGI